MNPPTTLEALMTALTTALTAAENAYRAKGADTTPVEFDLDALSPLREYEGKPKDFAKAVVTALDEAGFTTVHASLLSALYKRLFGKPLNHRARSKAAEGTEVTLVKTGEVTLAAGPDRGITNETVKEARDKVALPTAKEFFDAVLVALAKYDEPVTFDDFIEKSEDEVYAYIGLSDADVTALNAKFPLDTTKNLRRVVGFALRNQRPKYSGKRRAPTVTYDPSVGRGAYTLNDAGREKVASLTA